MTPRPIELIVGSLVLHGRRPSDRRVCGDAFVTELERLLRDQGLPDNVNARIDSVDLLPTTSKSPSELGRALARAIFRALSGQPEKEAR